MKHRDSYPRRPEARRLVLAERQQLKMARSAHAYVRGTASRFYEWLEGPNAHTLPAGPSIWICGDCHVGNLGPIADAEGRVAVQIRDFDQAVVGNPAHDLVRLALSLAMASRGSDLPGVTTARILEQVTRGYLNALRGAGRGPDPERRRPGTTRFVVGKALRRSWKHLLKEEIEDTSPRIPLGSRFWPIVRPERQAIEALFGTENMRRLVTSLRCREDDAAVELLDAAYWMKGCSSLGRLRFAVLLRVSSPSIKDGRLCLMDVKEAVQACAPRSRGAPRLANHGQRVVQAARALSPFLGERMRAARLLGRYVFVRELLPQDLKIELERVSASEATEAARFLASVVGRAHARQLDAATRKRWSAEVERRQPKSLDAPSWLWTSVVDLIARHESAYLEHCRRHALQSPTTARQRA
jgi:uncharacterized protein (DUF2252 family)